MSVLTRLELETQAKFHARMGSTTNNPQQTADIRNTVCEAYQWVARYVSPARWSYLTSSGGTIDGITIVQDTSLLLTALGAYVMETSVRKIDEISDLWVDVVSSGAGDPNTLDGGTWLTPVEPHELLELKAQLSGSTPRYWARRPKGVAGTTGSGMGIWQILVAPAKPLFANDWYFTARARLALSNPDDDISVSPVLAGDSSQPEVLPHESRLIVRLAAFELLLRNGGTMADAQRIVRNIDESIVKSYANARKLAQGPNA